MTASGLAACSRATTVCAVNRARRIFVGGDSARLELLAAAAGDARLSTKQAPTAAGCSSPRILARCRLDRAGELVHVGDDKTG